MVRVERGNIRFLIQVKYIPEYYELWKASGRTCIGESKYEYLCRDLGSETMLCPIPTALHLSSSWILSPRRCAHTPNRRSETERALPPEVSYSLMYNHRRSVRLSGDTARRFILDGVCVFGGDTVDLAMCHPHPLSATSSQTHFFLRTFPAFLPAMMSTQATSWCAGHGRHVRMVVSSGSAVSIFYSSIHILDARRRQHDH